MPQFIEADVIQKIATPAEWATLLGTKIPYKGQIMLVSDGTGKVINIKVGDGTNNFASLEYMFDTIQANVNYVQVTDTALPTPTITSGFSVVGEGTYTRSGQPDVVVPAGSLGILGWNGTVWSLSQSVVLPVAPANGVVLKNNTNATNGKEVYYKTSTSYVEDTLKSLIVSDNVNAKLNILDGFGYINDDGELVSLGAGNFFKVFDFIPVEEGEEISLISNSFSGTGNPRGMWGYDSSGNAIQELVGSEDNSVVPKKITIPLGSGIKNIRGTFNIGNNFSVTRIFKPIPKTSVEGLIELTQKLEEVPFTVEFGYINDDGAIQDNVPASNWRNSPLIDLTDGTYKVQGNTALGGAANLIVAYDQSGVKITTIQKTWNSDTQGLFEFKVTGSTNQRIRISGYKTPGIKLYKVTDITGDDMQSAINASENVKNLQINTGWVYPIIWGAIGHSIWWQDGQPYDSSGIIARGIQTLLREKISISDYKRYCYSGNSLGMLVTDDPSSILQSTKIATWVKCDVYTVDTITNDFKRNIPLGTQVDFLNDTGATTYYGALRKLHNKLFSLNNLYKVIASNALKRDNASYTSWSANTAGHTLTDYSEALKWVCNRLSWVFVDQFQNSGVSEYNLNLLTMDGLHPNDEGYKYIVWLWINAFLNIQFVPSTT